MEGGRRHEVVAQVGRGLVQLSVISDNGLALHIRRQGDAESEWERVHTQIMISARLHVWYVHVVDRKKSGFVN